MKTINISLPEDMLVEAKKVLKRKHYASISELVRDALRKEFRGQEITENGFTRAFEDEVLRVAEGTTGEDIELETEEDVDNYFRRLKLPAKKK